MRRRILIFAAGSITLAIVLGPALVVWLLAKWGLYIPGRDLLAGIFFVTALSSFGAGYWCIRKMDAANQGS